MTQFVALASQLTIGGVILNPDGTIKSKLKLTSLVPDRLRRLFSFLPCELQHNTTSRNIMADAVVDLFDLGSAAAAGTINIYTENGITLLASVPMANPAFDDAANGIAAGLSLPWTDLAAVGSGSAYEFVAVDRDDFPVLTGNVSISGDEITFPDAEIAVNDIVKLLSVSYTAPP